MKVCILSDMQSLIDNSGVGMAKNHQIKALEEVGIEYTTDITEDYDILHINTVFPQSLAKSMLAKYSGKAVIYHAHSTEEDFKNSFKFSNIISPYFKEWLRICYKSSDLILTPSEYSKKLLENYDLNVQIEVISNGIDLKYWTCTEEEKNFFRNKYDIKPEEKLVISVGLQIKRKGIEDFVSLAKALPQYKFIWFGYTNPSLMTEDVKNLIENKPDNLIFPGFIQHETLRIAYASADLYVFPTYEETEGIVLLEALASKTDALVRDIEVFSEYQDGIDLYKAKDFSDFVFKTENILEKKLPSLVENGYKKVKEKDMKSIGKKYLHYYNMALEISKSKNL